MQPKLQKTYLDQNAGKIQMKTAQNIVEKAFIVIIQSTQIRTLKD